MPLVLCERERVVREESERLLNIFLAGARPGESAEAWEAFLRPLVEKALR